jgi:hypothetical protein
MLLFLTYFFRRVFRVHGNQIKFQFIIIFMWFSLGISSFPAPTSTVENSSVFHFILHLLGLLQARLPSFLANRRQLHSVRVKKRFFTTSMAVLINPWTKRCLRRRPHLPHLSFYHPFLLSCSFIIYPLLPFHENLISSFLYFVIIISISHFFNPYASFLALICFISFFLLRLAFLSSHCS